MSKKNLYDPAVLDDILQRLEKLTPDSSPEWGKMDVAQMLAHCAEAQDVYNGKPLRTPFLFRILGPLMRPMLLAEKPFARNAPTLDQFRMVDPEDFHEQYDRLVNSLKTMHALGKRSMKHPMLGKLGPEEIGWITYKHMDHHLRQFGV